MRLGIKAHRMGSHRGRGRCAGDLFIPRSDDGTEHPRLSEPVQPAGQHNHSGSQLPLDTKHPGRGQRRDRLGS
jgi:hypothetical protein